MTKVKTAPQSGAQEKVSSVVEKVAEEEPWYIRGERGFEVKRQMDIAQKLRVEKSVPRFLLKPGETAVIVFVDSTPFFLFEHNIAVQGKWGNYLTCTKEVRACPVCERGLKSTYTAYLTIIDRREFVRKRDGKTVSDRKVLYPAKGSTIARIEDLRKKHGDLTGCMFEVKRYTKDDPNCGTDFTFIKKVKLTGDNAIPVDYNKVLYPPTAEELHALGFADTVVGRQVEEKAENQIDALDEIL
ncbi:MAG: hypothetical protein ACUVUQ_07480 [Thermodesulfovibrionales bacterium]